jgi:hypothetical protein
MTTLPEHLPERIRAAFEEGTSAVIHAVEHISHEDDGLALLTLWILANEDVDPEYARVLAIRVARAEIGVAVACRLWLMENRHNDIGVANTLLGGLEAEAVETSAWPAVLGGALYGFLRACSVHPETSVKAGVVSTLALARRSAILESTFPAAQGDALVSELQAAVDGLLDSEEHNDLRDVEGVMHASTATALPLAPRVVSRVVLDLMDESDRLRGEVGPLDPLVTSIQRRVLLDDAGVKATTLGRPIQTFRVLAPVTATRLVEAIVAFGEAVVGTTRQPTFAEVSAPDYGTALAWAPAASVPMHLLFEEQDARSAFTVLEALVAAEGKSAHVREVIDGLDPVVANAVLRLIDRLKQHEGRVEIVLTDADVADWQRTIVIDAGTVGSLAVSGLQERTRAAVHGRSVVVHKDHVPQANTVQQVFQAMDAMMARGVVTADDITDVNNPRQVNYYKQGARILGLFDEDNRPTGRARALQGLAYKHRLSLTSVYFEDTPIGRAWRTWAGKDRLAEVDPLSAVEFLEQCVVGLSGTTPARRASTLRAWFNELMPYYPGGVA